MNELDYINRYYGLSLSIGSTLTYTGNELKGPQAGTIAGAQGAYLLVDTEAGQYLLHPTWEITHH